MVNTGILRGLVTSRPPTLEQAKRQNRRDRALLILALVLLCLLITLTAIPGFQQAWQSASWGDDFWDTFTLKVFVSYISVSLGLFVYTGYFALVGQERIQGIEAYPMRQAAATGDDLLAPLAADQPERLTTAGRVIDPEGESFNVRGTTKGTRFIIRVDGQGIEWKQVRPWLPRRTHRIAWSEARAFYAFNYGQWSARPWGREEVYVLDAPHATLAWVLSLPWSANPRQDQAAAERLLRLIATSTGLPLRDLSDAVDKLDLLMTSTPANQLVDQRAAAVSLFSSTLARLPQPMKPAGRQLFAYTGLIPIILMGLIAATAFGLQTYQRSSYTSMLAQIHTHQPLFHDDLRAPNALWTVHLSPALDTNATPSYGIKDGSYQLSGPYAPDLTAPGIFSNVAVEVTARLLGPQAPDDQYASWGLLLHSDGYPLNGITFDIDQNGIWLIGPLFNTSGSTNAINTAPGASNRLTVILLDHQDILYINNQFVGIYQDTTPATGPVGFEASTTTASVAFNDFTIYPL